MIDRRTSHPPHLPTAKPRVSLRPARVTTRPVVLIDTRIQTEAVLLQALQQRQQDQPRLDRVGPVGAPGTAAELDLEDGAVGGLGALDGRRAQQACEGVAEVGRGIDQVEEVGLVEGDGHPGAGRWGRGLVAEEEGV